MSHHPRGPRPPMGERARQAQSLVGRARDDLETPVLLLDLDAFEANLAHLAAYCRRHGTAWRPHSKAHKCPEIAAQQLAAGACGITCAKLSEVELMVAHGIGDILLANQQVDPAKLGRLAELQRRARVIAICDDARAVAALSAAAAAASVAVPVLIDIDIGMSRTGATPGDEVLQLARAIEAAAGLELLGVMGYEGHVLNVQPPEAKVAACHRALALLVEGRDLIQRHGMAAGVVSAGGTGSFEITAAYEGITELQAGGGIFMDAMYREAFHVTADLRYALTCLATVTSRKGDRVILDAGFKTLSAFHHAPHVRGRPELKLRYLSAEHGVFTAPAAGPAPELGERLELVIGYSDSTTLLHDCILGVRQGRVERVLEVAGRGLLT
ncbi:MAG: alanine racemase [Gemmatimonadota bacterium]